MDDGNRRVVESEASQDQDNDQIKTSQNRAVIVIPQGRLQGA